MKSIVISVAVLIFFILIGVVFDIIGLAIATADEKQFHSMSARKIASAKVAIKLIRNAEKVASFCNDVIGESAGIISGSIGAALAADLFLIEKGRVDLIGRLVIMGLVSALTVGSKAWGKSIAINHSNYIVNIVSKIIFFFTRFGKIINIKKKFRG